ncbi:unnamed protein product [Rotaria socialis]|uniref:Uncharacterized protein n=2 Tax=Rotaria socialis TaxID=392032 RepID=A0A820ISE3_9BILA|nr:unnamed protein product [Rotaria socialis]CAF4486923.1 unnamed protein product [Rotaria socialis]
MVILGHTGVGKSCLAARFAKGHYQEHGETTIGAAFLTHTLHINADTILKIELWDTAGQERYHSLAPMYYRGAQAALVVYDISNSDSLRRAKLWVKELRQANGDDVVIGLAGNKVDLATGNQRQVAKREVAEYAEENGLTFMETSARLGDNVMEIFMDVARQVVAKQPASALQKPSGSFPAPKLKPEESGPCCGGVITESMAARAALSSAKPKATAKTKPTNSTTKQITTKVQNTTVVSATTATSTTTKKSTATKKSTTTTISTTTTTISTTTPKPTTTTTITTTELPIISITTEMTETVTEDADGSQSEILDNSDAIADYEEEASLPNATASSNIDHTTTITANKKGLIIITTTSNDKKNSRKTSQKSKSKLPLVLGLISGGLTIIGLLGCLIIYALIHRRKIKIFNRSEGRKKNNRLKGLTDSTSTIPDGSSSQR